jgi:formylglycine-generating enzyme required for sulfatase activity
MRTSPLTRLTLVVSFVLACGGGSGPAVTSDDGTSDHVTSDPPAGEPVPTTECYPLDHKGCCGRTTCWYDSCGEESIPISDCQYGCREGRCLDPACPDGFVLVKPGWFLMGSPMSEPGHGMLEEFSGSEDKQHVVTIGYSFCLKATEITQAEWRSAAEVKDLPGRNPSGFTACDECPVEQVNWYEAVWYCNLLSEAEGLKPCYLVGAEHGALGSGTASDDDLFYFDWVRYLWQDCTGYRLPSEAEWEYAARAGTTGATYNGVSSNASCTEPDPVLDPIAWHCGNSGGSTHSVGGLRGNDWGLGDMLGNVGEWVQDFLHYPVGGGYDGAPLDGSAWENPSSTVRVYRGGSYQDDGGIVRAASRMAIEPLWRGKQVGFRPARSAVAVP